MPPTIKPKTPPLSKERWIANSVELGPGIKFVAPYKSKNFSLESQFLLLTISSSIIATWEAGPPKAVVPNLRKTLKIAWEVRILLSIKLYWIPANIKIIIDF